MKSTKFMLAALCMSCALFFWSCTKKNDNGGGGGGTLPTVTTEDLIFEYDNKGQFPPGSENYYNSLPPGVKVEAAVGTFPSKTDSILNAEGYTKEHIVAIKGEELDLSIVSPPGQNFDFMDSIWIYVSQLNQTAKRLYGYKFNYPKGLNTLNLDMTRIDVKDVFNSDSVKLYFEGTKRDNMQTLQPNTAITFRTKVRTTVEKKQ